MNQKRSQQLIKKGCGGRGGEILWLFLAFHLHFTDALGREHLDIIWNPSLKERCRRKNALFEHIRAGLVRRRYPQLAEALWDICSAAWILRIFLLKVASATSSVLHSSVAVASATSECREHDLPPGDLGSASVGNLKLERGPTECRIMSTLEGGWKEDQRLQGERGRREFREQSENDARQRARRRF